jgi:hypothetical protein
MTKNSYGYVNIDCYGYWISQVGAVSLSPNKFVRFPCCYYRLKEIKNKKFRVASNGVTSLRDFIRICPSVLKLKHKLQTDMISSTCALFMHIVQNAQ